MGEHYSSEMDLVFAVGYWIKDSTEYDFYLNKYMGDTEYGRAFVDMLVLDHSGDPALIVEFNMNRSLDMSGQCDCEETELTQYKKYCTFGLPVWTCNGYQDMDATIEYITDTLDKTKEVEEVYEAQCRNINHNRRIVANIVKEIF